MKKTLLLLLIAITNQYSYAQQLEPHFTIGYGSYSMTNISAFYDDLISQIPFPVKKMESFPNFYNFDGGCSYIFNDNKSSIGISVSYMSTGAHSNVTDYSGSYTLDLNTNATGVMLLLGQNLYEIHGFQFRLRTNLGILKSKITLIEDFELYGELRNETFKFRSNSFAFEPHLELNKFFKFIGLFINAGYLIDTSGKVNLVDEEDAVLKLGSEAVKTNWSGFRIRTGIKFLI